MKKTGKNRKKNEFSGKCEFSTFRISGFGNFKASSLNCSHAVQPAGYSDEGGQPDLDKTANKGGIKKFKLAQVDDFFYENFKFILVR